MSTAKHYRSLLHTTIAQTNAWLSITLLVPEASSDKAARMKSHEEILNPFAHEESSPANVGLMKNIIRHNSVRPPYIQRIHTLPLGK